MVEVRITYETLFDLLRRERSHEELQKLDSGFYDDVVGYLNEKKGIIETKGDQSELFGSSEVEKIKIQFENIKKIIKELYEKREKKILQLAMNKVRTGSNIIDTSALLESEQKFFDDAVIFLSRYKASVLERVLRLQPPEIPILCANGSFAGDSAPVAEKPLAKAKPASVREDDEDGEDDEETDDWSKQPPSSEGLENETGDGDSEEQDDEGPATRKDPTVKASQTLSTAKTPPPDACGDEISDEEYSKTKAIRIISPVPKFLGKEKEIYGPFDEDEVANLPAIIADILIRKGRAEEIQK